MNPPAGKQEDKGVKEAVLAQVKDNELPCALAFDISKKLNVPPGDVGAMADALGVRLCKCQMGLFGYKPKKKIVKAKQTDDAVLMSEIRQALAPDGRLRCADAWDLARKRDISRLGFSNICEGMGVKISGCQLGAF